MPHKNPFCTECKVKMVHYRWIDKNQAHSRIGLERWNREVICPNCGRISKDIMAYPKNFIRRQRKSENKISSFEFDVEELEDLKFLFSELITFLGNARKKAFIMKEGKDIICVIKNDVHDVVKNEWWFCDLNDFRDL